jgi:hypothetical protein
MSKLLKKSVAAWVAITLSLSTTFVVTRQSEAAVGLATGMAPLAIVGAVMAVSGVPAGFGAGYGIGEASGGGWNTLAGAVIGFYAGIALAVIGVILLEDGSEVVQFRAVSPEEAQRFGLTPEERRAFNGATEELTLMAEEAGLQAQKTLPEGREAALHASATAWNEALQREEPELASALSKVLNAQLAAVRK